LSFREGYLVVTLCWLCASLFGAAPYLISGFTPSFIDAFFESVSAFTTTGSTVFDVEAMPGSLTLWKAVSHLLGGMGIIVFAVSIMPALGIGGQKMYKAESTGPTIDKVTSRISDTAKALYITYIAFGITEFALLSFSPMGVFDALIHTFGSISTSGLTNHYSGIGFYNSSYVELVISGFTILASVNFALYARAVHSNRKELLRDTELRAFFTIIFFACVFVSLALFFYGTYTSISDAFRYGCFQVISFATTTGQYITDYSVWPIFCQMVLLTLMFIGGCASSTAGSIKVVRVLVMLKLISREITEFLHPRSVTTVKLGGKTVSEETVSGITTFILTYIAIFFISNIVLSLENLDFITTISTSAAMLSNTGCALNSAGAFLSDYSAFSGPLKLFLSFLMVIGRLELFTVLVLLSPAFRKRRA
jgi:trk system potassium uptake protein TrkH